MINEPIIKPSGRISEEKVLSAISLGINPINGGRPLRDRTQGRVIIYTIVFVGEVLFLIDWMFVIKDDHIIGIEIKI